MDLYQSLREPPILTAVIGAESSDGIALVADTQLTRSVDREFEFMDDKKIKADFEHFIVGYTGTERTFEIFRKYMIGELTLEWSTQKILHSTNLQRATHCLQILNKNRRK
jgi:hypothetical protein